MQGLLRSRDRPRLLLPCRAAPFFATGRRCSSYSARAPAASSSPIRNLKPTGLAAGLVPGSGIDGGPDRADAVAAARFSDTPMMHTDGAAVILWAWQSART